MANKVCAFIFLTFLVLGCQKHSLHMHSPDRSQSITVLTFGDHRYIINGTHRRLPDSNYVKLDISKVDQLGDALLGCWKNDLHDWELLSPDAIVLENKLDTASALSMVK